MPNKAMVTGMFFSRGELRKWLYLDLEKITNNLFYGPNPSDNLDVIAKYLPEALSEEKMSKYELLKSRILEKIINGDKTTGTLVQAG